MNAYAQHRAIEDSTIFVLSAILSAYALYVALSSNPQCKCKTTLKNKIVVITGGTDGVGKETAIELARRGATLILPCRNMKKGQATAAEIAECTGNDKVVTFYADFENLGSVKECVQKIERLVPKVDILINNAGIGHGVGFTHDGVPKLFGVNHLAPYLLTTRLLKLLRLSSSPRVIFVSSVAHLWGKLDFSLLHKADGGWVLAQFRAYARSKLANVLFAREIHHREKSISTYVAHPGWTFTALFRDFPFMLKLIAFPLFHLFLYRPKVGAQTQIHLALAAGLEKQSGGYFVSCRPSKTCKAALDRTLAADLWSYSEQTVSSLLVNTAGTCTPI